MDGIVVSVGDVVDEALSVFFDAMTGIETSLRERDCGRACTTMSSPEESSTSELFGIERRVLSVVGVLETFRMADRDDDLLLVLRSVRGANRGSVNEVIDPTVRG